MRCHRRNMTSHFNLDPQVLLAAPEIEQHLDADQCAAKVSAERMRQFMTRQRLTALSGVLPAAYLIWLHWPRVDHADLLLWWLCLAVVDLGTVVNTTLYLKAKPETQPKRVWLHRQIAFQSLAGLAWGSVVALFYSDVAGEMDRAIVLMAVNAVGVIGLLPFRMAFIGFGVGMWSIPLGLYALDGNDHHQQLALGIVVLLISLNFYLWEASQHLVEGIEKRYQALALAQALHGAAIRINQLATRDELTGLPNRREGMQILERNLAGRRENDRFDPGLSVILLDVDHFKRVNDVYGRQAGDEVLRKVSLRLANGVRKTDTVSRIGGEEFLVVLPATPATSAYQIAQKLCDLMVATPIQWQDQSLKVSISLGVAQVEPRETIAQVLARADAALYEAKEGGRNRVVMG